MDPRGHVDISQPAPSRELSAPLPAPEQQPGKLGFARSRAVVLLSALVAGLAAFAVGELSSEWIPAETVHFTILGTERSQVTRDTPGVVSRSSAIAYGALGLCLGSALGIAGGIIRRRFLAAASAGLLGSIVGGVLGASASLLLIPYSLSIAAGHEDQEILIGLVNHGLIWGSLGASAGVAFAIGRGDYRGLGLSLMAGLTGAVLGSIAFDLLGIILFPLAKTDSPISQAWQTQLMARLLVALGTGTSLALLRARAGLDNVTAAAPQESPTTMG